MADQEAADLAADVAAQADLMAALRKSKAAFPSIAHAWIILALKASGAPNNVINLVQGLYHHCRAFVKTADGFEMTFFITYIFNFKCVGLYERMLW